MIRVNCSVLIRLQSPDERYALLGARSDESQARVFSPIGGTIKTTEAGFRQLCRKYQLRPKSFGSGQELQFIMSTEYLPAFAEWLHAGTELEPNPAARMLFRDLGPQGRGLLNEKTAQQVRFELVRTTSHLRSHREEDQLVWTQYFFRIYAVQLTDSIMATLEEVSKGSDVSLFKFVTRREIRIGRSSCNNRIAGVSNLVL